MTIDRRRHDDAFVERLYETLRADLPKYEVENKG
jgi:hypothetical protein